MLRALFLALKIALFVAVAVWVADRPGSVRIEWMDYEINVKLWFVLLAGLVLLVLSLLLHRFVLWMAGTGRRWRVRRDGRRMARGLRALALGYGAVAAGDAKIAAYQAHRARELMPDDRGVTLMLTAQAARLAGDRDGALTAYNDLLTNKETAFIGLRGLISTAAESGNIADALDYARRAQAIYPQAPWIVRTLYTLEVRNGQWDKAWKSLRGAEKAGLIPADKIASDRVALHIAQADEAQAAFRDGVMLSHLRQAVKADPGFVPAVVRLAKFELQRKRRREAVALLEKAWKANPHPELALLWAQAAPPNKPYDAAARLRWFEKLVSIRPDSVESQLAAAEVAGEDRLWMEARQYLVAAERIQPTARLYRLWAACEDAQGHFNEGHRYMDLAATAAPEKVWTCRETGRIYEYWSPVAEPHGSFNTIVWDYPRAGSRGAMPLDVAALIEGPV